MAADRENKKSNQTLREFKGVNTRNARTVIHDDQFAWLENVMPIGSGNMVAVPGPGSSLALWPTAVYMMESVNLNNVDMMIGLGTNGAGYSINLTTYAVTTFAPAGTFQGSGTVFAQWQNTAVVIVVILWEELNTIGTAIGDLQAKSCQTTTSRTFVGRTT